jgi:L-iditol 2-dehydrogenase
VAQLGGAGEVTVVDPNQERLAVATRYGADHTTRPDQGTSPVDRVLECSGVPAAMAASFRAARPGGRVVLVGTAPEGDLAVPLSLVQRFEVDVVGSFRYANAFPTAIEWAADRRVDLEGLVTASYPLSEAAAAFEHAASGAGLKTTVRCADGTRS